MARKRRGQIELDERAAELTDEAVFCRRFGHGRVPAMAPPGLRESLASRGQAPALVACPHCGYTRGEIIDTDTWDVVGRITPSYPDGYLFKDGRGRWSRREARREYYARTGRY